MSEKNHYTPREEKLRAHEYEQACKLESEGTIASLARAVDRFARIKDYKDAAHRMERGKKALDVLVREKAQKEESEYLLTVKKSKQKTTIVSLVLAVVVLLSVFLPLMNSASHNVDNIKVEIVEKTVKYDPDASAYINGLYYVYFDYEIKNGTGETINYVKVVTRVSDKDGNELGEITSSFGGIYSDELELEKNDSVTLEVYFSENQPEKNDFFKLLYDTDIKDLEFTHEIVSVGFADGELFDAED